MSHFKGLVRAKAEISMEAPQTFSNPHHPSGVFTDGEFYLVSEAFGRHGLKCKKKQKATRLHAVNSTVTLEGVKGAAFI